MSDARTKRARRPDRIYLALSVADMAELARDVRAAE